MYGSVPSNPLSDRVVVCSRSAAVPDNCARPKSRTFTRPLGVTMMLAGLRSRCTTPRSCASSSAAATSLPSVATSFSGSGAAADVLRQCLARHVLHHQEVDAVAAVEVVHRGDVGVVQPGQRLRFTAEPPPCRLVAQRARRQHLEGDVAVEVLVAGAVDLAHPAFAQLAR